MEQGQGQEAQAPVEGQQSQENQGGYFESLATKYEQIEQSGQKEGQQQQVDPERQQTSDVVGVESNQNNNNDQDVYQKLERIAKAERAAVEREMRAKQMEEEAIRLKEKYSKFEQAYNLKEQDPMAAIEELGLDFGDIQERYRDDKMPSSRREAELMKKVQDLEKKQTEFFENQKKAEEEQRLKYQKQQEQQQVSQLMKTFENIAAEEKDPDGTPKYELIQGEKAYQLVFNEMEKEYQQTGKIIDPKQAMDKVEKNLEQILQRVIKYKKFGKYGQSGDGQTPTATESFLDQAQHKAESFQPSNSPNTLNSSFTTSNPPASNRPMDRSESIRRAAEILQYNE